jgi:NDP-sugar pyrophosphorylase family protein
MYVLQPQVLELIEDDKFLDMTDLIKLVTDKKERVGAFPVSEGSWTDMGNWNEYLALVNKFLDR